MILSRKNTRILEGQMRLAMYIVLKLHSISLINSLQFMFFNVIFMFGGSGTQLVAMAFSFGKSAETLRSSVHLDQTLSRIVLYGTSLSVGMYVSCPYADKLTPNFQRCF